MTSFAPISSTSISSAGADAPVGLLAADTLTVTLTEGPVGMFWMNDLTDQLSILLTEVAAPVLANRDLADTLAILATIDSAAARVAVVKVGADPLLLHLVDQLELLEQLFSPAARNRGIVVRADFRASAPQVRKKVQTVGRDRAPITVGRDRRKGEGSGL
jgi:hypothetical protein